MRMVVEKHFKVYKASGRAICNQCREKIPKDSCQFQIFYKDKRNWWNRQQNYHAECILKQMEPFAKPIIVDWQSQFNLR